MPQLSSLLNRSINLLKSYRPQSFEWTCLLLDLRFFFLISQTYDHKCALWADARKTTEGNQLQCLLLLFFGSWKHWKKTNKQKNTKALPGRCFKVLCFINISFLFDWHHWFHLLEFFFFLQMKWNPLVNDTC